MDVERDPVLGHRVLERCDLGADLDVSPDLVSQPRRGFAGGCGGGPWKVPHPGPATRIGELADEVVSVGVGDDQGELLAVFVPDGGNLPRDFAFQAVSVCDTTPPHRTGVTAGIAWRADQRAEFHRGLVESAGVRPRQHRRGELPQPSIRRSRRGIPAEPDPAAIYPLRVPFDDRQTRATRDRQNRPGGVATDSG